MADDPEFQELQVRVSELERLVKHQADQLAVHVENVEKHAARLAEIVNAPSAQPNATHEAQPQKGASTPLTEAARQAASQGRGAFS